SPKCLTLTIIVWACIATKLIKSAFRKAYVEQYHREPPQVTAQAFTALQLFNRTVLHIVAVSNRPFNVKLTIWYYLSHIFWQLYVLMLSKFFASQ
ncbi:MAG: hypothetical protein ACYT04_67840, partial [Nostoc sp.]